MGNFSIQAIKALEDRILVFGTGYGAMIFGDETQMNGHQLRQNGQQAILEIDKDGNLIKLHAFPNIDSTSYGNGYFIGSTNCSDVSFLQCASAREDVFYGNPEMAKIWNFNAFDDCNATDCIDLTAGLKSFSNKTIRFFPNPAVDKIQFEGGKEVESVQVLDITGKLILDLTTIKNNEFSVFGLNPGFYTLLVRIRNEEEGFSSILIKQ